MPDSLTMRILQPKRLSEWNDFQRANSSRFVKERDPLQIERAAEAKKIFVLDDHNNNIRGTCGVFEHGDGTFREVGAVRILINGFGLQVAIMTAAVTSEWTYDPTDAPCAAITSIENAASQKNIVKSGFIQVDRFSDERLQAMNAKFDSSKVYYTFPETSIPAARIFLKKISNEPEIKRGMEVLKLRLEIPIVTDGLL